MKERPKIILDFEPDDSVTWNSVGWGKDASLMAKAKKAINMGKDPAEVVVLLNLAGFDVGVLTETGETEQ